MLETLNQVTIPRKQIMIDLNGTLWKTVDGVYPGSHVYKVSLDEIKTLEDPIERMNPWFISKPMLLDGESHSEEWGKILAAAGFDGDYFPEREILEIAYRKNLLNWALDIVTERRHLAKYINPYYLPSQEYEALIEHARRDNKMTIVTALYSFDEVNIRRKLIRQGAFGYLRQNFMRGFLRENNSPIFSKAVDYRVAYEIARAEGNQLVGAEDEYPLARFLAGFFIYFGHPIDIYMGCTEPQARAQMEYNKYDPPKFLDDPYIDDCIIFSEDGYALSNLAVKTN